MASPPAAPSANPPDHRASFFQQGSWMAIATVASGIAMALVHTLSKKVPDAEYAAFGALLKVLLWMALPAIGFQATFARQAAGAVTSEKKAELAAAFRAAMLGTFVIWAVIAGGMALGQHEILRTLKIAHPAALWLMVVSGLGMLWQPIVQGVLQGRESFGWLGWTAIFNGMARLAISEVIVACGGMAAGIMTGTLVGLALAVGTGLWLIRDLWRIPPAPFNWQAWLRAVVPLSAGCGIGQIMFGADMIVVQSYFDHPAPYIFGGTLAGAIVILAGSFTAVMFPRVVRSLAHGRKTNVVTITLVLTLVLGLVAAEGLRIAAPLAIQLLSKKNTHRSSRSSTDTRSLWCRYAWQTSSSATCWHAGSSAACRGWGPWPSGIGRRCSTSTVPSAR